MGVDFTVFKGSKSGEIVEAKGHRDPGPTEVIVKISHCGVCSTDQHFLGFELGLGHEGVGTITEVGSLVSELSDFKIGDRVGMGWYQKFCGYCKYCVTGYHTRCVNKKQFGTANWDQGCFGTAIAWDVSTLFHIPDAIPSEVAGPLMCAGATVWEPLYNEGFRPGDRVGVVGIGGLGHLAIQFASKLGFEVVAFSTSESKKDEAIKFGASEFCIIKEGEKLEGVAKVDLLLITTSLVPELSQYTDILAPGAKVFPLTISFSELKVPIMALNPISFRVVGSAVAQISSVRAMLAFAAKHNIKPQIEKFPMTKEGINEAIQKLKDGKIRYRGVVVME